MNFWPEVFTKPVTVGSADDAVDVAEAEGVLPGALEEAGEDAEDEADAAPGTHSKWQV